MGFNGLWLNIVRSFVQFESRVWISTRFVVQKWELSMYNIWCCCICGVCDVGEVHKCGHEKRQYGSPTNGSVSFTFTWVVRFIPCHQLFSLSVDCDSIIPINNIVGSTFMCIMVFNVIIILYKNTKINYI